MASKVVIDLRPGTKIQDIKDRDVLMYDAAKKNFYIVSPETFFSAYEDKLNALLKRYDEQVKEMRTEINETKTLVKDTNTKLINMVEAFIKEGER